MWVQAKCGIRARRPGVDFLNEFPVWVEDGTCGRLVSLIRPLGILVAVWDRAYLRCRDGTVEPLVGTTLESSWDSVRLLGLDISDTVAETIRALDAEQDDPPTVSLREASDMVDLTVAEVELLIATADFPSPEGYIRGRPYWETATVERWIKEQDDEGRASDEGGPDDDQECCADEQSCPCPIARIASALEGLKELVESYIDFRTYEREVDEEMSEERQSATDLAAAIDRAQSRGESRNERIASAMERLADVAEQAFLGEEETEEEEDSPAPTAAGDGVPAGVKGLAEVAWQVGLTVEELEKAVANGHFPPDNGYIKGNLYWRTEDIDAWAQAGGTIPVSVLATKPKPNTILVPAPGQRVKTLFGDQFGTVNRIYVSRDTAPEFIGVDVRLDDSQFVSRSPAGVLIVGDNPRMVEITLPSPA